MTIDGRVRVPRRDSEEEPKIGVPRYLYKYQELYGYADTINRTLGDLLKEMDDAGISKAVLHAEFEFGDYETYRALNSRVAALVERFPDRFVGVASVDPRDGDLAMQELNRALLDLELKGLNVSPSFLGLTPNDRVLYPFYARCAYLKVPVCIHIGTHFSIAHPLDLGNPVYLDEVACRFPDLQIVGMHGGWPWVLQAIAVARRHRNVYLEFGGIAPRYFAKAGSGWEPAFQFANSVLQDQVFFASDWPILSFARMLREHSELPWKPEVKRKIFEENIKRLFPL